MLKKNELQMQYPHEILQEFGSELTKEGKNTGLNEKHDIYHHLDINIINNDFSADENLSFKWQIKKERNGRLLFEYVSTSFAKLYSMHEEDFYSKPVCSFLPKNQYSRLRDKIYTAQRKGFSCFQVKFGTEGNAKLYNFHIVSFHNEGGTISFAVTAIPVNNQMQDPGREDSKNEKNLLNKYLEIAGVIILVLDINGRVKYINKKGSEILYYPKELITGKDWFNNFLPENISRKLKSRFRVLMAGKEPDQYYQNHVLNRNGEQRLIYWHSSLIRDNNGNVTGLLSSGEDITEQQNLREKLTQHSQNAEFLLKLSKSISDSTDFNDLLKRVTGNLESHPRILGGKICILNENGENDCRKLEFGKHSNLFEHVFKKIIKESSGKKYFKPESVYISYTYYGVKRSASAFICGMYTRNEYQGILILISDFIDNDLNLFYEHVTSQLARGLKRKKIEIEHKISEELFSTVFHTNPDAMTIASAEGAVFLEVNKAFEEMTGFSRNDVVGKSAIEIQGWKNPADRFELINILKKNKKVSGFLVKLYRKNGEEFDGLFSANYIDYKGRKCMLAVVKDITERIVIEKENLKTKQLLERITFTTPSFICLYDVRADNILYRNRSVLESLGYKGEKLKKIVNLSLIERDSMYHPDDVVKVKELNEKTLQLKKGEILKTEYRIADVRGKWNWFQSSVAVYQEADENQPLLTVNVFENITERKYAEEALSQHSKELELLFDAGKLLTSTLDLNELYDNLYTIISGLADCRELIVTSYDESEQMIHYRYMRSEATNARINVCNIPPIPLAPPGFGILSRVIRSGESMILDEYSENFRKVKTRHVIDQDGNLLDSKESTEAPKSAMIIPIKLENKIMGVVQIYSGKPNAYTHEQLKFAESLMLEVALANKNAILYDNAQQEIIVRRHAEEETKRSLKDKELLLREIHHRVKNNLQVVSSLLYLQSQKSRDHGVNVALLESQQRVKSMVLIHEKLYRSEDLGSIDYSDYISALTNTLFRSYRLDASLIRLELDIGKIRLNTDAAVQCGLIINELVSNSMKHAFPDNRKGTISINFNCDSNGEYCLEVKDDGVGLKKDFTMETDNTLGMLLIKTLVEQMDGTIEVQKNNGAAFIIKFLLTK